MVAYADILMSKKWIQMLGIALETIHPACRVPMNPKKEATHYRQTIGFSLTISTGLTMSQGGSVGSIRGDSQTGLIIVENKKTRQRRVFLFQIGLLGGAGGLFFAVLVLSSFVELFFERVGLLCSDCPVANGSAPYSEKVFLWS